MPDISIRRIGSRASVLRSLHQETFPADHHPAYTLGTWWVARNTEGKPVAFAGMQPSHRWSDTWYFSRCGVLEEARGLGLQRRLIRIRIREARRLGARWAITSTFNNPTSVNNLIACGFRMYEPKHPWGAKGTLYWKREIQ